MKRKLPRRERVKLVEYLKANYSYDCIEDINDQKIGLGIIIPKITDKKFEERKNVDSTVQSTLVNDNLFMTIQNYGMRSAGQNVSHTLYMYMCLRKPCNSKMNLRHLVNNFYFSRYGSNTLNY